MSSLDYLAIPPNSSERVKSIMEDSEIENEITAKIHELKISPYKTQIFDDVVWFEILKFLPVSSVPTVSRISKQLATVHNHKALWHIKEILRQMAKYKIFSLSKELLCRHAPWCGLSLSPSLL